MVGGWTLDYAAIDAKGLNREEVETFMARALLIGRHRLRLRAQPA
ncbi:MAG: hypothetical protein U1F05_12375 [Burkholderiales bacterium]